MANPQRRGTITIEVVGEASARRGIVYAEGLIEEEVSRVIYDAGEELLQLAQINLHRMKPPGIDTGALVGSLKVRHEKLSAVVYSELKYSPYIEFGTRPHFPPLDPIKAWVRRKLRKPESLAYPIARAIAKRGTPPRPFLGNAFADVRRRMLAQFKAAVSTAIRKSGKK